MAYHMLKGFQHLSCNNVRCVETSFDRFSTRVIGNAYDLIRTILGVREQIPPPCSTGKDFPNKSKSKNRVSLTLCDAIAKVRHPRSISLRTINTFVQLPMNFTAIWVLFSGVAELSYEIQKAYN
ncbi:hypothetical protein OGM63_01715 [Plectonema radiosum NIES-515]|uniref:Transposase n=1 Tax=Plectonema radiosum NIES-515 TaxID=2986073 RepID=A0ABT3AT22_9CYAN|nr:hypothetical protein [Plectonema radiosum]MCV3212255.1 hypothetical protein [Plectonema radiosum NIES-515]